MVHFWYDHEINIPLAQELQKPRAVLDSYPAEKGRQASWPVLHFTTAQHTLLQKT